jgi:hypothetical protein
VETAAMWQKRFTHHNMEYTNLMKLNDFVTGLMISDDDFKFCETRKLVKSKKQPAIRKKDIKTIQFAEVISIDIE